MTDYTITADQQGAYEIPLEANKPVTVTITAKYVNIIGSVTITAHSFNKPVYVRTGPKVTIADPLARQVNEGTWEDFYFTPAPTAQVTMISAEPAVVSVARS